MVQRHSYRSFWFLLVLLIEKFKDKARQTQAYEICHDEETLCPTHNTCCFVGNEALCVTQSHNFKNQLPAVCCQDVLGTACPPSYDCDVQHPQYCSKRDKNEDDSLPERLPRYKACRLPRQVYEQVHGFGVKISTTAAPSHRLAYLSTMGALDAKDGHTLQQQSRVQTLLVVVHGSERNPDDYICGMHTALPANEQDPQNTTMMVVAPWFLAPDDDFQHGTWPYAEDPLRWDLTSEVQDPTVENHWRYGGDATAVPVSSFAVLDQVLNYVVEAQVRFPKLAHIIVTGHSAGGQFVQRWALLSQSLAFESSRWITTRVVVANPKSYSYLDHRRFINGTFMRPPKEMIDQCPHYNDWLWGLEHNYLSVPYLQRAQDEAGGAERLRRQFGHRSIIYLSGDQDILENGDCMDRMQGQNRRERSAIFFSSLDEVFGLPVHHRLVVPDVNHDHCLMYQSIEGRHALFGLVQGHTKKTYAEEVTLAL